MSRVDDRMLSATPAGPVRWAAIGKRKNQHDDYTVLADDSGGNPARRRQYVQAVGELSRSNPSSAAAAQGALPWAYVSPVDTDAGQRIALVVVEWPEDEIRDATGRRASLTRYFDVDSVAVSQRSAGYLNLYDAFAPQALENGDELVFAAASADASELAQYVIEFGPRTLAGVAALLLDGAVVIMPDPASNDVRSRLLCLDAALALLPYGIRDSVAVATWTPNDTPHGFRLMFSNKAVSGQHGIRRGQEPVFGPGYGQHYFDRIMRYLDHGGAQAVERLVKRLWDDRRGYSVQRPEQVLQALADLDLVYAVYQDLCRSMASVDDVVRLLRRPDVDLAMAEPEMVDRLVQEVIDNAESADLTVLGRHWNTWTVPSLVVGAVLGATETRARALWEAARVAGAEAPFVVSLVQQVRKDELEQLAGLLARRPVPDVPELGEALLVRPAVLFRLLTITFVEGRRDWLGQWADLVFFGRTEAGGRLPLWAEPFAAMRSGRSELSRNQLTDQVMKGTRTLPALLALAAGSAGAGTFVECYTAWQALFNQLRYRQAEQVNVFRDVVDNIALPAPSSQAGLDLLRLAAGLAPAREQAAMDAATTAAYLNGLRGRFAKVNPSLVLEDSAELAALLVPGRLTRPGVDFLLRLAEMVGETTSQTAEGVYRWLGRRAAYEPEALYGQPDQTIQYLIHLVPELGAQLARRQLGDAAGRGWTADQVIPMCLRAQQTGMSVIAVLDGLGPWKGLDDPPTTYRLIEEMWKAAGSPGDESEDQVLQPGLAHVLEGACGVQRARDLNGWMTRMADWHRQQSGFLSRLAKSHKPPKSESRRPASPPSAEQSERSE